jgi:DNA repair protein RadD
MFSNFVKALCPKACIGVTATPVRLHAGMDGSILKMINRTRPSFFKEFVYVMQIKDIIDKGRWTPIHYETYEFDSKSLLLNTNGSEYTEESIREFNKVNGINNKIYVRIKDMLKQGYKSILLFCDAIETAEKFSTVIPDCAVVSGDTPKKQRDAIVERFLSGEIKVLANHSCFSVGFDYPELQAVIMGRPTGSFRLYYQIIGRGVRIHESKKVFRFIDFGMNYKRFGKVEDVVIEDHPTNGWSVFAGDRLLSGVPSNGPVVTRKHLEKKAKGKPFKGKPSDYKLKFGKYKGNALHEVPLSYLHWILNNTEFKFDTVNMKEFKAQAESYLNENVLSVLQD